MKLFKYIGIISLLVFSFYLTDYVTELAINSNPLMQTIIDNSNSYMTKSVDAIVEDNTIIPGIKGSIVNEIESFKNMKDFGEFNENYLVYDYIYPNVSIKDNTNKIIISGNKKTRKVTILIKDNKTIYEYVKLNNIVSTKLISHKDNIDYNENINIESDEKLFDDIDTLLNKKELNKKICILNYSNIKKCKEKKYYIVKPNIILKNNNLVNSINNLEFGSIILIDDYLSITNFKILISSLKNKDINIVYLSKIIEE